MVTLPPKQDTLEALLHKGVGTLKKTAKTSKGKQGRSQKNFRADRHFLRYFDEWCADHGHDRSRVLVVAFFAFSRLSYQERAQLFQEFRDWADSGYGKSE